LTKSDYKKHMWAVFYSSRRYSTKATSEKGSVQKEMSKKNKQPPAYFRPKKSIISGWFYTSGHSPMFLAYA